MCVLVCVLVRGCLLENDDGCDRVNHQGKIVESADKLTEGGIEALGVICDVTVEASCESAVANVVSTIPGGVDSFFSVTAVVCFNPKLLYYFIHLLGIA